MRIKKRAVDFFWATLNMTTMLLAGTSIGILAALSMLVLRLSGNWILVLAVLFFIVSLILSAINHRKRSKLLKRWRDFSDRYQEFLVTSPTIARYHAELRFLACFGSPSEFRELETILGKTTEAISTWRKPVTLGGALTDMNEGKICKKHQFKRPELGHE